jgi:hypothetical protein
MISLDTKGFIKDMNNIVEYSLGFLDGVNKGKSKFLSSVGVNSIDLLKSYVDANARVNPEMLQHVYEWGRTGSPSARLFDIDYTVSNLGLSLMATFRQSSSIKPGSNVPFYNKAYIMENGIPVTIAPKKSKVLVFEDGGETVFTKSPVNVSNPGGVMAENGFEKTFNSFFTRYFTQSFLRASGIADYLENPTVFSRGLPAGKKFGKNQGIQTGYRWIANAGVGR